MRARRVVCAAVALAAAAAVPAASPALAGRGGSLADGVYRYPDDVGTLSLAQAIQTPAIHTIVFQKGPPLPFSSLVYVIGRTGLTLCGSTGDPADTVIESSAPLAFVVDECRDVEFRNLTIRCSAAAGEGIRLQSVTGTEIEGFVDGVSVRNCRIEAAIPIRARPRTRNLEVANCRLEVNRDGGFGLVWEDGPGLFVTRTRFATSSGVFSPTALFVRGASDANAEGDRARGVFVTRNTVDGDFASAIDLVDVLDARVQRNTVRFPGPIHEIGGGRVGLLVRRAAASLLPEDWELRKNRVSGAHTGVWIISTGRGAIVGNDLRGCGSADPDAQFEDTGSAVRVNLQGDVCNAAIERNDLRNLRSPKSEPACVVLPAGTEPLCFRDAEGNFDSGGNRWDAGRPLYLGATQR